MTHVNVISVVMSSSNVLDLNAYKYQRSYPDMVKREIWGMRKLYVPSGSRKLNAVNGVYSGGNTQSNDIRGITEGYSSFSFCFTLEIVDISILKSEIPRIMYKIRNYIIYKGVMSGLKIYFFK